MRIFIPIIISFYNSIFIYFGPSILSQLLDKSSNTSLVDLKVPSELVRVTPKSWNNFSFSVTFLNLINLFTYSLLFIYYINLL